jgi:hypothetical protein
LITNLCAGENAIPHGRRGYYFLDAGELSWGRIAQEVGAAGCSLGLWPDPGVKTLTAEEFSGALGIQLLDAGAVEAIWGSK